MLAPTCAKLPTEPMMTEFTPWASLAGGTLIGLAAVALMALNGRILGATGILAGAVLERKPGDTLWRWVMLAGMVSGPAVVWLFTGTLSVVTVPVGTPALIIGGFLVGIGVSLGAGCTSGHGVCGLARLSPRSLVAVPVFMASTFATVYVLRHVIGG